MAKKNDAFYYDSFAAAAELACKAAIKLDDIMRNFDPSKIEEAVEEMHAIEQAADEKVHEVNDALITAFITPIEREDIATLAGAIDVVVDRIEGVAIEQAADEKVHEVNDALITAFITPIEREDIATLAGAIDVVVDRIEGVLHRIYFTNIQEMRPDALEMSAKVVRATEQMHDLVLELPQFKRPRSFAPPSRCTISSSSFRSSSAPRASAST